MVDECLHEIDTLAIHGHTILGLLTKCSPH